MFDQQFKGSDQPAHMHNLIRAFASHLNILGVFKLLTEHHLEFLSLKGGCTGSSKSTLVKMQHSWKSHVLRLNYIDSRWSECNLAIIMLPVADNNLFGL